jgi:hypothetical protein
MEATILISRGESASGPEFARREIRDLVANWPKRDPEYGYGFCGGVVCQVCGEVVTFTGLAASHGVFRHGEAVAGWKEGRRHRHTDHELASLVERVERFCEICRCSLPLDKMTRNGPATTGAVKASPVSSDPDPSGGRVVTYDGWPLYLYVSDPTAGTAHGQAINSAGGLWYVISPSGTVITKKANTGTGSTSGSGSSGY